MEEKVKQALESVPQFRERRYRAHFILIMALREVGAIDKDVKVKTGDSVTLTVGSIGKPDSFEKLVPMCESITRVWRKVLSENEALRGSDYSDKTDLEIEKLEELNYFPLTSSEADKLLKEI